MFQALARDRLERLNASPSAVPGTYFLVFSVLLLVFSVDLLWYGSALCSLFSVMIISHVVHCIALATVTLTYFAGLLQDKALSVNIYNSRFNYVSIAIV